MNIPVLHEQNAATLTSFVQLFGREIEGHIIKGIEIPLIQRDYAQGRKTERVTYIRQRFIESLCKALQENSDCIDLDFVFGDVNSEGIFYPLDGQQRLTTLFLLHCYLGWQVDDGKSMKDQPWHQFSYATRPGARVFCQFLVKSHPNFSGVLSEWIKDDADYLPTWQHDPTIQSMLVVLDTLHNQFSKQGNLQLAWLRLTDLNNPAIRFHIYPMTANNLTDALYIKMNSRGKPLTDFENFKAHFEELLKKVHPEKIVTEFALKVDTDWSDILWAYRDSDNLIDDEFLRYFRFVTEVNAWKNNIEFSDNIRDDELAEKVYGNSEQNAQENLMLLMQAFDIWLEVDAFGKKKPKNIKYDFEKLLTRQSNGASMPLRAFNFGYFDEMVEGVDLFYICCRHYPMRPWRLAHTLILYAVLLKFIHPITDDDFARRFRLLRNLIEASGDEIRAGERNNMPELLAEVELIILSDDLSQVRTFNQVQVKNEQDKVDMIQNTPTVKLSLHQLEDHDLLRGGLIAFDLDPIKFAQRASTFLRIFDKSAYSGNMQWKTLTAALLAMGDYSREGRRSITYRTSDFGAPKNDEPWLKLFQGRKGESIHPASIPLMALLDKVAAGNNSLQSLVDDYLNSHDTLKDWRYYLVKYEIMREGASGRFIISESGYQICMLEKERMSSYYRDPYLLAIIQKSGINAGMISNPWPWFYGHENEPRKLILSNSGIQIQCVDQGWGVSGAPTDPHKKSVFDQVCKKHEGFQNDLLAVPQSNGFDACDRVELGAKFLMDLVQHGF